MPWRIDRNSSLKETRFLRLSKLVRSADPFLPTVIQRFREVVSPAGAILVKTWLPNFPIPLIRTAARPIRTPLR